MLKFLMAVLVLGVAAIASAKSVPVRFGQDIDLASGDVAVVSSGHVESVVTCAAAPAQRPLPATFNFEKTESVLFVDQLNAYKEKCAAHMAPEVDQMIAKALAEAKQLCASIGYQSCTAPAQNAFVFTFTGDIPSQYGCQVSARMVGTATP